MTYNEVMEEMTRHEAAIDSKIADALEAKALAARTVATIEKYGRMIGAEVSLEEATAKLAEATATLKTAESHYGGWSRFFLVQNTNGHIHSSMHCSTCRWDTSFGWLTELSGLTEAEAVEEYGEILCSICFPSAPVEWTTGTNKKVAAERELHKALTEIERSPEGKKVKSARELIRRKTYSIEGYESKIRRMAEYIKDGIETPTWMPGEVAKAEAELPKIRKQLDKAEAKLAEAEAALTAALAA